jgi:hypothetical protein
MNAWSWGLGDGQLTTKASAQNTYMGIPLPWDRFGGTGGPQSCHCTLFWVLRLLGDWDLRIKDVFPKGLGPGFISPHQLNLR